MLNEFQSVPVQYILGFNKGTGFMDTNMYSYRIDKLNFKCSAETQDLSLYHIQETINFHICI